MRPSEGLAPFCWGALGAAGKVVPEPRGGSKSGLMQADTPRQSVMEHTHARSTRLVFPRSFSSILTPCLMVLGAPGAALHATIYVAPAVRISSASYGSPEPSRPAKIAQIGLVGSIKHRHSSQSPSDDVRLS